MVIFICPHCAISKCRLVTLLPLTTVADQPSGRCFIISIYCSSVKVARSSDKREIVWGWEPGARVTGEHRRLMPFGNPPPVIGACVHFVCGLLPTHLPTSVGISASRSELNGFLVLCNSFGIIFVLL
jgi:hypothetical protein